MIIESEIIIRACKDVISNDSFEEMYGAWIYNLWNKWNFIEKLVSRNNFFRTNNETENGTFRKYCSSNYIHMELKKRVLYASEKVQEKYQAQILL